MTKYRKKPIVIEAEQWLGGCEPDGTRWKSHFEHPDHTDWLEISTLEGIMKAHIGDWIITGVEGEKYPCKDSIFRKTYEKVNDENEI